MSTPLRPFLFLDVDETVLAGGRIYDAAVLDREGASPERETGRVAIDIELKSYYETKQGRLFLDQSMIDAVRELSSAFDIVWTSAWGQRALQLDAALGIDSHYCLQPQKGDLTNYKGRAIINFLNGHHTSFFDSETSAWDNARELPVMPRVRPFAWADDDQDWDEDLVTAWAAERSVASLIVRPEKDVALTRAQVDELLAFAAEHGA